MVTLHLFWLLFGRNTVEIQISTFRVEICSFPSFGINFLNFASRLPFAIDRSIAPS